MKINNSKNIKINILKNSKKWLVSNEFKALVHAVATKTLKTINFFKAYPHAEISLNLSDDEELQALNQQFFNKKYSTNVLSFPYYQFHEANFDKLSNSKSCYLGDIAISYSRVFNEAAEQNKFFQNHFIHLFIHSILHLCGYDHIEENQTNTMEQLELEILKLFNINNPYEID